MVDGSWLENMFLQGAKISKECCRTVAPSTDNKKISRLELSSGNILKYCS